MNFFDDPVRRDYEAAATGQRIVYQHRGFGIEYDLKQYVVPPALFHHMRSSGSQSLKL